MRRSWSDLEDSTRFGIGTWVLLACPLFGFGAALDSRQWQLNDLGSLIGLLFGVPVALVLVTSALAGLRPKPTLALAGAAIVVTCVWGALLAAMIGSAAS